MVDKPQGHSLIGILLFSAKLNCSSQRSCFPIASCQSRCHPQGQTTSRDQMWKRSIRHTQLLTKARNTRIQPCCHQFQELAWTPVDPRTPPLRHAWNWTKIKPDPKNPFFAKRSTRNTPHTAVVLLRNADVPMLQIQPPVFMPSSSEEGTKFI